MRAFCICAMAVAGFASPAMAADVIVPLGVIVVPPTQTFTPGVTFVTAGENSASFEFAVSQAMTLTASSFTNSSVLGTGVFDFTSIGLFQGLGSAGTLLASGTISSRVNGTQTAALDPFWLGIGAYTIKYSGTVSGPPAGVGGNITFVASSSMGAVPEPASWGLMIGGFGMVGVTMRRRKVAANTVFV